MSDETWFTSEVQGERLSLRATGRWTIANVQRIDAALGAVQARGAARAVLDIGAVESIDSAGALALYRARRRLADSGVAAEIAGVPDAYRDLIDRVAEAESRETPPPERVHPFLASLERLGHATVDTGREATDFIGFFGLAVVASFRVLLHPGRLRLVSVFYHMEATGFRALPIVGLLAFLIGVVLAYQSADQLARFGAQIFTVNLLGISILREIGIVLTAIVVAGRSGSAFTAQIGTMKVREEVDAMRTLGMDPIDILVLPRLFALVLVMPLLAFYADIMGLLGGAIMSLVVLDISMTQFIKQLKVAITPWTFWVGIIKAPVFAYLIALVGCFQGLRVEGNAESVGRLTTESVVMSIFLIIVADAFFSILFSTIGI